MLLDLVQIVPEEVPLLKVMVCVKVVTFLVIFNVCSVPSAPLDTSKVDFRAMGVNVFDADFVKTPLLISVST